MFCRTQTQFGEIKYLAHLVAKYEEEKIFDKCISFCTGDRTGGLSMPVTGGLWTGQKTNEILVSIIKIMMMK